MNPRNVSDMRAALSPLVNGQAGAPPADDHPPDDSELAVIDRPDIAVRFESISFFKDLLTSLKTDLTSTEWKVRAYAQKELVRLALEISKHMRVPGTPKAESRRPKFNLTPKVIESGPGAARA